MARKRRAQQKISHFERFDSVAEFSATLKKRGVNKIFEAVTNLASQNSASEYSGDFYSTDSYDEADNLLTSGDDKSFSDLKITAKITANSILDGTRRRSYNNVCGYRPDVAAYLAGSPYSMKCHAKVPKRAKVITVICNSSIDFKISYNEALEAFNLLFNLIKSVERQGVRVNLYVAGVMKEREEIVSVVVKIKGSGEKLNILKCAYPLVNSSFLRRHLFRYIETFPQLKDEGWRRVYGYPVKGDAAKDALSKQLNFNAYFDYYQLCGKSAKELTDNLNNQLAASSK